MTRAEYQRLEEEAMKALAEALGDAYDAVAESVEIPELARRIAMGDVESVAALLAQTEAQLSALTEAIERAYVAAGRSEMAYIARKARSAGVRSVFAFDHRLPAARQWVDTYSRAAIDMTKGTDRDVIRQAIGDGVAAGRNPRDIAIDLMGRKGKDGKRVGGMLGLNSEQAKWASNAKQELQSLDPRSAGSYFSRRRRDKRFDKTIRRAIAEKKKLTDAQIAKISAAYEENLLNLRAETIARTAATDALNAGRTEALDQAVASGNISASAVKRVWDSAGPDGRTRDSHRSMDGQTRSHKEPFLSPSGARLRWPGDVSLGAPGSETVNCRCYVRDEIDFFEDVD